MVGGTVVTGDNAGFYSYSGGELAAGTERPVLRHELRRLHQSGAAHSPSSTWATAGSISGWAEIDEIGNGISTPADRNTFFHLNQVRRIAKQWLPGVGFLDLTHFTSNVNIPSVCNAVYTGNAVNFYRAGGRLQQHGRDRRRHVPRVRPRHRRQHPRRRRCDR